MHHLASPDATRKHEVMSESTTPRPPLPPLDRESALTKVQAAEDARNTCDPERVAGAYSPHTQWRNSDQHLHGRPERGRPANLVIPPRIQ